MFMYDNIWCSCRHAWQLGIRDVDALLIRGVLDLARCLSLPSDATTSSQQPSRRAGPRAKLRFKQQREAAAKVDPAKFWPNLNMACSFIDWA